ncbi:Endo-1,4-beta-xylanase 1 [Neonectria ditissima]|uniref:Beta-xylanase n=1 Tax=Neonectria ditissima TaxID=78410 RepID=A0A0P7BHA4_9HYPO|nr:Endo-1,4-beta-xylanase 1 [Neonectria ditissima]
MYKSALLGLLASSSVSAQLHSLALDAGLLYFGTTVDNGYTSDEPYMAIANDAAEFGQLVPENGQKWDATEPSRDAFTYAKADVVPALAKANGQILRCHALTWHSQLPAWVSSGGFSSAELQAVIEAHIANVVGHFKGDCYAWDVVNEAVADDGSWRSSVFYETMGTDFLAVSFNAAREADPDAKLYYNDYNLEYNGAKTDRAVEVVQILQDAGAPIDGVGFQGHLMVGSTPSRASLATALERFTALGVEVAYTELDIRHAAVPASDAAAVTQANDFANVVGSCLDVAGCVGVTVWGFTDKYSWIPDTFSGAGEACIYDADLNKKPAWTSISSLLAAAATGSATAGTTVLATTAESTPSASAATSSEAVSSAAPETTPASTPTFSTVVSSQEAVSSSSSIRTAFTPIFTPSANASVPATTFQTRTASTSLTGGFNFSSPHTTFQTRTTAVAPVSIASSEPAAQYPTLSLPAGNQTAIAATTVAAISSAASTRVPVIRHSTTAYSAPWSNGTFSTAVANLPSGTGSLPAPTETDDEDDDEDCYEEEELVAHYYQCGGKNYDGPTECEEPYVCEAMNEYYSQCVASQ